MQVYRVKSNLTPKTTKTLTNLSATKNYKVWELQNEKTFENWGPIKYCENWEKYDNMRTKKYENYRMRKLLNPPPKLVYL